MKSVLEEVLDWSADRPSWQRDALRRVVLSGELTQEDIDALTAICKGEHGLTEKVQAQPLAKEHVPERRRRAQAVYLESIFHQKGVNALAENQTLKFVAGLTLISVGFHSGSFGYTGLLASGAYGSSNLWATFST
ncbi:MAG: hypothetical protein KGO02_22125 [Alphaproteobacteria bacterium]|nr:hypothetical protein [Alphaproteobacteria bacterium]